MRRRALLAGAVVASALIAQQNEVVALNTATASPTLVAGTLDFRGVLRVDSTVISCPPEAPPAASECRTRTGTGGGVAGLGSVSVAYVWSYGLGAPTCPLALAKPLATTGRLVVAGKGEFQFALAQGAQCVDLEPVRNEPQNFTITGGTGVFQSASGSGTVERSLSAGVGTETWKGTLAAPGIEFDLTPPKLIGATSKTVRAPRGAKRVRVTYRVTATDNDDGAVPVRCEPPSGSRFPIGRTVVKCSATDSAQNTGNASFRIIVRRTR